MTAEVLRGRHGDGCRAGESRLEEPVSAQPEHTPIPSYAPAPDAPAELLPPTAHRPTRRAVGAGLRTGVGGRAGGVRQT